MIAPYINKRRLFDLRILIIEDEMKLAEAIAFRLKKEHYIVDINNDGETGLDNALTNIYDLIILDVMLPKVNGFDILKEIKNEGIETKVIMLTAKSMLEDKLYGFESGANDYITKPFHMDELVARVNAQLRNNVKLNKNIIEVGDLVLNIDKANVLCKTTNETIDIMGKEYLLLEYFMNNANQVISREQIYNKIWGFENNAESNNLEAYLSFIRKKLRIIGTDANIKAVRGLGYKLEVRDEKVKD